jgi:hypothetical protein
MVTVSLYLVWESKKAFRCSEGDVHCECQQFWLPKSQIRHLTITGKGQIGWQYCRVTIPDWLADEKWLGGHNPFGRSGGRSKVQRPCALGYLEAKNERTEKAKV